MLVFLAVFLTIYGAEHAYLLKRLAPLFGTPLWLGLVFLLLIPLPILSTVLLHNGHTRVAQWLGWIGFSWMGVAFLLFSSLLLADGIRLVAWLASRTGWITVRPDPLVLARTAALLGCLLALWAFWTARRLQVVELPVTSGRLAHLEHPVRVLQISDLHLGVMSDKARVARVVEAARALAPDLILCTGDLVDGPHELLEDQAALLATLDAPLGKFAVTGNHEAYATRDGGRRTLETAGFRLLRNEGLQVLEGLSLAGLDDPTYIGRGPEAQALEQSVLGSLPAGDFRILLKHQPILGPGSRGLAELQLSGHTHNGQIFPFGLLTRRVFPVPMGLSEPSPGFRLYLSRGTGSWGPPMRLFQPPELTLLELSGSPSQH